MMCYDFILRPGVTEKVLDSGIFLDDTESVSDIYYVEFDNKLFENVRRLAAYIHEPKSVPLIDASLWTNLIIPNKNHFLRLTYQSLKTLKLEPPYDTMCSWYPDRTSRTDVRLGRIQKDTVKILNMSIPNVMIYDMLDTPIISPSILNSNVTMKEKYQKIVEKHSAHMAPSCYLSSTIPRIYALAYPYIGVTVMWPDGLSIVIESRPKTTPIDLIIYISSCVGIWFGLSIQHVLWYSKGIKVTMNPFGVTFRTERERIQNVVSRMNRMESNLISRFYKLESKIYSNYYHWDRRVKY